MIENQDYDTKNNVMDILAKISWFLSLARHARYTFGCQIPNLKIRFSQGFGLISFYPLLDPTTPLWCCGAAIFLNLLKTL
jgi:hypothetical protein